MTKQIYSYFYLVNNMLSSTIFRIKAGLIHLFCSLLVVSSASLLIFYVWYPGIFSDVLGGFKLFILVVFCDVILGPLLTIILSDIKKSKNKLIMDYGIVIVLQLAALGYGMYITAGSRPVYIIFEKDRLEVVTAIEYEPDSFDNLTEHTEQYRHLPLFGPKKLSIKIPDDKENNEEQLFLSIFSGLDDHMFPRFYQPYENSIDEIKMKISPLKDMRISPDHKIILQQVLEANSYEEGQIGWLLVHHRFGFCTALMDKQTGHPVQYIAIDPMQDI